jgi:hypothetical protein
VAPTESACPLALGFQNTQVGTQAAHRGVAVVVAARAVRQAGEARVPEGDKLWERATRGEAVGEIAFAMAARPGVKARTVRQRLWLQHVELPASKGQCVAATCLVAREFDAPAGVKPIEWRLLTNRAARRSN